MRAYIPINVMNNFSNSIQQYSLLLISIVEFNNKNPNQLDLDFIPPIDEINSLTGLQGISLYADLEPTTDFLAYLFAYSYAQMLSGSEQDNFLKNVGISRKNFEIIMQYQNQIANLFELNDNQRALATLSDEHIRQIVVAGSLHKIYYADANKTILLLDSARGCPKLPSKMRKGKSETFFTADVLDNKFVNITFFDQSDINKIAKTFPQINHIFEDFIN